MTENGALLIVIGFLMAVIIGFSIENFGREKVFVLILISEAVICSLALTIGLFLIGR